MQTHLSYHDAYLLRERIAKPHTQSTIYNRECAWRDVQEGRKVTIVAFPCGGLWAKSYSANGIDHLDRFVGRRPL